MQISYGSLKALPPQQVLALGLAEYNRRQQLREAQAKSLMPETGPTPGTHTSLLEDPSSPFHDLIYPHRYKTFYGGRDSAKSWAFAEALVRRCANVTTRVLCTREFQASIKDSVHKLLRDTITRLGLDAWYYITDKAIKCKWTGSEFIFKGLHNNVTEIKSTEGIDIVWVEEAHLTSDASWEILIPTLRKEGSEIWSSFNVTSEDTPSYQRLVVKRHPDSIVHQVSYKDNPYLSNTSKGEIEELKKNDYNAYEHVYEGKPLKFSESIIFGGKYSVQGFDDDLWKQADRLFFGADWGFAQDPSTLIRSFILNNRLYVEHEGWGKNLDFAGKMKTIDDVPRGELEQMWLSVPGALDWPVKADNSRPETISFMCDKGWNVEGAEKWEGCVEDGIEHLKGFEEIIIHTRCKEVQQEARLYSFKRDRTTGEVLPVVIDKHNHGWDAIRYSLDGYIQRRGNLAQWIKLGKMHRG